VEVVAGVLGAVADLAVIRYKGTFMQNFSGKLVLITGGSSGIGLALAQQFFAAGANLWILGRSMEKLQNSVIEIDKFRHNKEQFIHTAAVDVTDYQVAAQKLNSMIDQDGTPDILINSAGATMPGKFEDLDIKIFQELMEVNYYGTVNVIKALIPHFISRKSGHIVNISSIAGFGGVYGYTAYCASKYAVRGFSDALRPEMKPYGIKVSVVFPPDTETPQLAFEEPYKPAITKELSANAAAMTADAVARSIIKGISKGSYIIAPGEASFWFFMSNFLGKLTYPVMDLMIKDAQKKVARKSGN